MCSLELALIARVRFFHHACAIACVESRDRGQTEAAENSRSNGNLARSIRDMSTASAAYSDKCERERERASEML